MATRAAQEAEILTSAGAFAFIERYGVVCESARRGMIPSLADAIAGESIRGNWWAHPKSRTIFSITRTMRDASQILVCRLVEGKITFVHERLWPALVRLAERFPHAHLARVRELHTATGKHVLEEVAFPDWVPAKTAAAAQRLSEAKAGDQLSMLLALAQ